MLTALEHCGLAPRLRFGNRQYVHGLKMEAELASGEFVEDAADPEQIDEEQDPGPQSVGGRSMIQHFLCATNNRSCATCVESRCAQH